MRTIVKAFWIMIGIMLSGIHGIMLLYPACGEWSLHPPLYVFFYILGLVIALLSALFSQARLALFAVFLMGIVCLMQLLGLNGAPFSQHATAILLIGLSLAGTSAYLLLLNESPPWSPMTLLRLVILLFLLAGMGVAGKMGAFNRASLEGPALFRPMSVWITLSPLTLLTTLTVSGLMFFIVREGDTLRLQRAFNGSILLVLAGLNFHSRLWSANQGATLFLFFMVAALVSLGWAVLEIVWSHAYMDELTELPARRMMKRHWAMLGPSFGIAIVDIDHFKSINDRFGHDTGDQILRYLASNLRHNRAGKVYRIGGEEFVIIVEGPPLAQAEQSLDDLRKAISRRPFIIRSPDRPRRKPRQLPVRQDPPQDQEKIIITVSIGFARATSGYEHPRAVLEAADQALYTAKEEGRNCLRVAHR